MRSFFLPGSVLLLLSTCAAAAVAQPVLRPDAPDSVSPFLRAPARNLSQLVQEVRRDVTVRQRYAQFFHVSEAAIAPYLSKNLLSGSLPHAGTYTVFYVSAAGTFYPTRMTLSPGTPVFVRRNGVPALLRGDGNPVALFVPPVQTVIVDAPIPVRDDPQEKVVPTVVPTVGADIPVPATR